MLSRITRSWRRGSVTVELSVVFSGLAMLVLPAVDFCIYLDAKQSVIAATQIATRDGARAEVYESAVDIALETADSYMWAAAPHLTEGASYYADIVAGDTIEVTIEVPYQPIANLIQMPTTVRSTYRMRLEHP